MARPKTNVPFQPVDIILELSSITLLILMFVYIGFEYFSLPETIPTHFNAAGEADGFGHKSTLWIIPGIALVLYVGLFILNKFPHLHNYMVNITEENAMKNYRISTRIVRIINFLTILLMSYIAYYIIQTAKGLSFDLGTYFMPIVIGVSVLLPVVILIYMKNVNKS